MKCTLKSKQSQPSPPTLSTESYAYALTVRVERLSANHPPIAPLHLQAYCDTARSLGYSHAVVSLGGLGKISECQLLTKESVSWANSGNNNERKDETVHLN